MVTVFYDGQSGLCSREIKHYRKIAANGIFNCQDITEDVSKLETYGVSYVDGLRFLHATDQQGQLYVGVDAFILIWTQIKRWRLLADLISLPVIYHLADSVYRVFARWRFNRRNIVS
jgi:predicted DCC family thiol-disulfide oxidoreductase YuxK